MVVDINRHLLLHVDWLWHVYGVGLVHVDWIRPGHWDLNALDYWDLNRYSDLIGNWPIYVHWYRPLNNYGVRFRDFNLVRPVDWYFDVDRDVPVHCDWIWLWDRDLDGVGDDVGFLGVEGTVASMSVVASVAQVEEATLFLFLLLRGGHSQAGQHSEYALKK